MHAPALIADDRSFRNLVLEPCRPTLVLFTAERCLPCALMARRLPTLMRTPTGPVRIVNCPLESSPNTFKRYDVSLTPTLVLFDAGLAVASFVGPAPIPAIRNWVAESLAKHPTTTDPADTPSGADPMLFSSLRFLLRVPTGRMASVGASLGVALVLSLLGTNMIRWAGADGYMIPLRIGFALLAAGIIASIARGLSPVGRAVPAPRPRP